MFSLHLLFAIFLDNLSVFGFFTILFYLFYRYYKFTQFQHSVNKKIENLQGPSVYPLIGSAQIFFGKSDVFDTLMSCMNIFGGFKQPVRIWMGPNLNLLCANPEDIKTILTSPYALEKHHLYKFFHPVIGNGLISAPTEIWKKHRKIISPMFNTRILETYVPRFKRVSQVFVEKLENLAGKGNFDAYDIVAPCNVDFLSETAIGVSIDAQKNNKTIQYVRAALAVMKIINHRQYQLWLHPSWLFNLSGWEKMQWDQVDVATRLRKLILEVKDKEETKGFEDNTIDMEPPETPFPSVFSRLMKQIDIDDSWSMKDVTEELDTLLLTGTDTSATNVCYTLMMLGIHSDVQRKAVSEIKEIFGNTRRTIEIDDLKKLIYLDQVIKESLRIFPIAPIVSRYVTQDIELSSCTVPAGTGVMICIKGVHSDPEVWGEDVHKFDPERFTPEKCAGRHPYAYIPFSAGPRNCIGMRYSNLATKYILTTILRNFIVKCDLKMEDIKVKFGVVLSIDGDYSVSVEKRIPAI